MVKSIKESLKPEAAYLPVNPGELSPPFFLAAVAFSLDIFGDRWTLLIIRDLFFGRTRFKDFVASPEGIPTNILTDRLERLLARGIVEQIPAEDGTKRMAYRLTKKGKALGPVLKAMRDWGLAWDK